MIRFFLLCLVFSTTSNLSSQSFLSVGSRSNALANASVALSDCWAYHHNPGALAAVVTSEIGCSYGNRFLLKELQNQGLVYVQPIKIGVISFVTFKLLLDIQNVCSYCDGIQIDQ